MIRLTTKQVPWAITGGATLFSLLLLLLGWLSPGFIFSRVEWITYDWRVKFAFDESKPAGDKFGLVYIDDDSLEAMNRAHGVTWPWPREFYGRVTDALKERGAKAVGFDVRFLELHPPGIRPPIPQPDGTALTSDEFFARRMRAAGNVALAVMGGYSNGVWHALPPADLFRTNAWALGHVHADTDADGVIRRVSAFSEDARLGRVWHIAIVLAAAELRLDLQQAEVRPGRIILRGAGGIERVIPVDRENHFLIDWQLKGNDWRIQNENIDALLARTKEAPGTANEAAPDWHGRLVVIGSIGSANNIRDIGITPLDKQTFLVSSHLNTLQSVLSGRFVRRASGWVDALLIVLLGLAGGWMAIRFGIKRSSIILLGSALLHGIVCVIAYSTARYWLPVVLPLFSMTLACGGVIAWVGIFEQNEKKKLRAIFGKVVAPEVVNALLKTDGLRMGGENVRVTVWFADIRGFTELSNLRHKEAMEIVENFNLNPQQADDCLSRHAGDMLSTVNLYLSTLADIVKEHGGTLDKYIGDCVMAFWGAPVPNEAHALHAVRAAIAAQRSVHALNRERELENRRREADNVRRQFDGYPPEPLLPLLALGSGINTGMVIAGLMGSEQHVLNYTVFGREVNLASRLEGASGQSRILIGENTFKDLQRLDAELAATCVLQPTLKLKGFDESPRCYEVPWRQGDNQEQFKVNETRFLQRKDAKASTESASQAGNSTAQTTRETRDTKP